MKRIPVLLCALLSSGELMAQEAVRREMESSVAFVARISDMSGDVDTDFDLDYGDLWGTGYGFSIESDFMFPLKKNWSIGGYLSAGFDFFEGETDTDDVGDTLEAEDLTTSHILFGFKAMLAPDRGFFFDARAGLGVVFWGAADGELTISGTPFDVAIFDPTAAFAAEVAAHVGYSTRDVYLGAGFAARSQGDPDESDDLAFEGTSSAVVASFELEVGFRF